jgi:peptidoglycan-associated lipoprotein
MKRHVAGGFLMAGCMMLVAGGCAKEQMVTKDEEVATTAAVAPTPSPAKKEVAKEPTIQNAQVKESAVKEELKPVARQGELRATLENIYFDFDSYKLTEAARIILAKNVDLMKNDPATKVRIEGNCDERGSDEYNLALGQKRAEAAKRYLVSMGVALDRLSVISYGEEKPFDSGHNESAWAKNRRDEFVVH